MDKEINVREVKGYKTLHSGVIFVPKRLVGCKVKIEVIKDE
jgi:putative transposon-encoded protein